MKKSFKKYLSLVMVLMVAFVCLFSVSVSAASNTETIDFKTNFATYAKSWSGYAAKTLGSSELGCSENVTVAFTRVSKQTSTITNMPVVAANNATEYITVEVDGQKIESATFGLVQWKTKTFTSIKIEYFNGSSWVPGSDTITTPKTLASNVFEGEVSKVRVAIKTTNKSNTQVAISTIDLVLKADAGESEEVKNIKAELNTVDAYMSLGYTYTVTAAPKVVLSETVVFVDKGYANAQVIEEALADSFNVVFSANTNESYAPTYYTTGTSIRCYGGNSFTVSSEYAISEIKFTYGNDDKDNAITVDSGAFDTDTWTGEAKSVTFTIDGTTGQRRIASIEVTYTQEETVYVDEYSAVDFRIKFAIDAAIADIEGVDSCGVCVATSEKAKLYASSTLEVVDGKAYAVVSLGDVLNNKARLSTEFTVKAYVVVEGNTYYSELTKEFSLIELVQYYIANAAKLNIAGDDLTKVTSLSELVEDLLK